MADTYKFDQSASQLQQDFDDVEALVGGGHPDGAELYLTPEKYTSAEKEKLGALPTNDQLGEALAAKQNVISDLSTIRSGAAAGATAVQPSAITNMEEKTNKVTSFSSPTDTQYPSAKLTYDELKKKATIKTDAPLGNIALFDEDGDIFDDGVRPADFATAAQGAKADTAYQKPGTGIPKTDLSSEVQTSLGKADTAIQDISGKADKVSGATNGNLAALDESGNLKDAGIAAEIINQLGQEVSDLEMSEIDSLNMNIFGLSNLEERQGAIDYATKWTQINNNYKHIVIPVTPGDSIVVRGQTGKNIYAAFVKTYTTPVNGQLLDTSSETGYNSRFIIGGENTLTVPSDSHYLVAVIYQNGESIPFSKFVCNGVDLLTTLKTKMDDLSTKDSNNAANIFFASCSTAQDVAAKEVSVPNFVLSNHIRVIINFVNSNTANDVTLNINSTGAKPLYLNNVRASARNGWTGSCLLDIYYTGTYYDANVFSHKLNYGLFVGERININSNSKVVVLSSGCRLLDREFRYISIDAGTYTIDATRINSSARCLFVWDKTLETFAIIGYTQYIPANDIIIAGLSSMGNSVISIDDLSGTIAFVVGQNHILIDGEDKTLPETAFNLSRFDASPVNVAYSFIGDSGLPINTEEHFLSAVHLGFNALKADIEITSDNVLICCHDTGFIIEHNSEEDVDEITPASSGYTSLIRDLTWSQISNFVYKSGINSATHYDASVLGHYAKVCTIEKYLCVCKTYGMTPFITIRNHYQSTIVPILFGLLRKYNLEEKCIINVNPETPTTIDEIRKESAIAYICYTISSQDNFTNAIVDYVRSIYPAMLMIDKGWVSSKAAVITRARSKGVRIGCYFVANGEEHQELINEGFVAFQIQYACLDTTPKGHLLGVRVNTHSAPTPPDITIQSIFGANSGKRYEADAIYEDGAIYISNIKIQGTERYFIDGIMPIWMKKFPYSLSAIGTQYGKVYPISWDMSRKALKITDITYSDVIRISVNV